MTEERLRERLENYKKALKRLEEALGKKPDPYIYDSVIKRFEFTYELAWKLMKALIEYQGGESVSFPRGIFKEAYARGLIKDGEVWLGMLEDRNLTSHTYDEASAKKIYQRVKDIYAIHLALLAQIVERELE